MKEITFEQLEHLKDIIYYCEYYLNISNTVGNACYEKLEDDHIIVRHELSRGGRIMIDIKYDPDWKDEDEV